MVEFDTGALHPRSILVAADQRYLKISQDPDSISLLEDRDALVIPYSAKPAGNHAGVDGVRKILVEAGQLVPDTLLVRNPYEKDVYEFADHAVETFASAKYHHLANVARLLGAREVRFENAKVEKQTDTAGVGLKVKIPGVGGDADVSREVAKNLDNRLEGVMTFPGSDPAVEAALEFLRNHNLSQDQQLRALVELRTGMNPISEYRMTLSGTRESDANLRSALSIAEAASGQGAVQVGASFARAAKSISSIEITTRIVF